MLTGLVEQAGLVSVALFDHVFQRHIGVFCSFDQIITGSYIGVMMLVMVKFQRLG